MPPEPGPLDRWIALHRRWLNPAWSRPRGGGGPALAAAVLLAAVAGVLAFEARERQWEAWQADRDTYFLDDSPLVSTADAGAFLTEARRLADPDQAPHSPFDASLLAATLRAGAQHLHDGNLLVAGNRMIPWTALLTALSIALCFGVLGFPAEGAVAALGGSVAAAFLVRSSIGRVDTDQMNLAFLFLVLAAIAAALRGRRRPAVVAGACAAGVVNLLFWWWYGRAGFTLPFALLLGFGVWGAGRGALTALLAVLGFLVFSGLQSLEAIDGVLHFASFYLAADPALEGARRLDLPRMSSTVTELGDVDPPWAAMATTGPEMPWLAALGCAGLLLFALTHPGRFYVLLPALALGAITITSGRRFLMYAVPLVWFGVAFLVSSSVVAALRRVRTPAPDRLRTVLVGVAMAATMGVAWAGSLATCREEPADRCLPRYVPEPVVSPEVTEGFRRLRRIQPDERAMVISWWDYGYWIRYWTGMAPAHTPGNWGRVGTSLVARALVARDQAQAAALLRYLAATPAARIEEHASSREDLLAAILGAPAPDSPVYLVLTDQMVRWWPSIATAGLWQREGARELVGDRFVSAPCTFVSREELDCESYGISLATGRTTRDAQLEAVFATEQGSLVGAQDYPGSGGKTLLVSSPGKDGGPADFTVMKSYMGRAAFTELFLLNRPDPAYFRLVDDGWPHYRTFELLRD